jgi:outer membrane protein
MKKNLFGMAVAATALTFMMASCNKQQPKMDEQPTQTVPSSLKIAYVEVDSLMSQYQFCKDYTMILSKKGQNVRSTLAQKGNALQAQAADFQQKVQANAYTRDQAERINAGLQRQQADLQALNDRLTNEFNVEQEKYNNALRDSLQHFLREYNKDKKYTLILSKAGDNILYADKTYDITKEVIQGLNKKYKPIKKD